MIDHFYIQVSTTYVINSSRFQESHREKLESKEKAIVIFVNDLASYFIKKKTIIRRDLRYMPTNQSICICMCSHTVALTPFTKPSLSMLQGSTLHVHPSSSLLCLRKASCYSLLSLVSAVFLSHIIFVSIQAPCIISVLKDPSRYGLISLPLIAKLL